MSGTSEAIIKACSGERGATLADVRAAVGAGKYVLNRVGQLVKRGQVFVGGDYHFQRYFSDPALLEAWLPSLEQERKERAAAALESRRKTWREYGRAKRAGVVKEPRQKLTDEERKRRKAERRRKAYELKRAKLGLTVKRREKAPEKVEKPLKPAPEISNTTPRKATGLEPPRGRGIVIQPSKFKPPKTVKPALPVSEPVITSRTKVTICPHYEDRRFKSDPSIAGRGVISGDWMDERLKRSQEQRR